MQPILFGFDSLSSNSMKSKNPHSGVHVDRITKTLDTSIPCPSKNQGGNAVVFEHVMQPMAFSQNQVCDVLTGDTMHTLNTNSNATGRNAPNVLRPVVFQQNQREEVRLLGGNQAGAICKDAGIHNQNFIMHESYDNTETLDDFQALLEDDGNARQADTLTVGANQTTGTGTDIALHKKVLVRRLTPLECERLQGFPDGHTDIPILGKKNKVSPDSARYSALGNSMTVQVMRWIGERIQLVEDELRDIEMMS